MASPAAELGIDAGLVRRLLVEQQPGLADLSIRIIANGWDNVVVRLGSDLTVRLPRRQASAQLLLNEQRWLPELAARLPLPIPAPTFNGRPASGYPWAWSICPCSTRPKPARRPRPCASGSRFLGGRFPFPTPGESGGIGG